VASIERAIVLLGLNAVKNISVAASLGQMFRGVKLCDGFVAKDLWTHCVAVAVAARELAKGMKVPLADEAFLAGMIHDIGMLVELQTAPESLQAVCERAKKGVPDFCALERELVGVDHQQLGMGLAAQWKFPRSCQLVAGYHHQPGALRDNNRLIVTLVYVADTIVCQMGNGFNLTAAGQELDSNLLSEMQIDPQLVERVRANLPTQLTSAASMFG
jgi:HD-like signal output (HDOD) protein